MLEDKEDRADSTLPPEKAANPERPGNQEWWVCRGREGSAANRWGVSGNVLPTPLAPAVLAHTASRSRPEL